jgi:hypothetical protein
LCAACGLNPKSVHSCSTMSRLLPSLRETYRVIQRTTGSGQEVQALRNFQHRGRLPSSLLKKGDRHLAARVFPGGFVVGLGASPPFFNRLLSGNRHSRAVNSSVWCSGSHWVGTAGPVRSPAVSQSRDSWAVAAHRV